MSRTPEFNPYCEDALSVWRKMLKGGTAPSLELALEWLNEIREAYKEIARLKEEFEDLEPQCDDLNAQVLKLEDDLFEARDDLDCVRSDKNDLQREYDALQLELASALEDVDNLRAELQTIRSLR